MGSISVDVAAVVTELYRILLLRDPDPVGLRGYVQRLSSRSASVGDILQEMLSSDEFLARAPSLLYGGASFHPDRFTNDCSQYGELPILIRLWVNAAAKHRIVVDVGARGRERSNSFDLLKTFGWKGVLIEANPALIPQIERDFAGLNMELINCAVSDFEGSASFFIGSNADVSSLNSAAALGWGPINGTVEVPVCRLSSLLSARQVPNDFDLLSIDIEGEDVKVFNDLVGASDFLPHWVILEASYSFRTTSLQDIPVSDEVRARYRIAGQTEANLLLQCI